MRRAALEGPAQRATQSAAHWADSRTWQAEQTFGVPAATDRSGRGTRKLWSRRGSTTMYVRVGMWHDTHWAASEPATW